MPTLQGSQIVLKPLALEHAEGLCRASFSDPSLFKWSPVPRGVEAVTAYIETALTWQDANTAVPFVIIRQGDGAVLGSTRFWNIERWQWPRHHERHGRGFPDACEIGYTWLTSTAIRTSANTEAKFLMLQHAFEKWKVLRVCFHTDRRNERSKAALERLGAKYEGTLRAHRIAADFTARDSLRYSIVASEWLVIKERLIRHLKQHNENFEIKGT